MNSSSYLVSGESGREIAHGRLFHISHGTADTRLSVEFLLDSENEAYMYNSCTSRCGVPISQICCGARIFGLHVNLFTQALRRSLWGWEDDSAGYLTGTHAAEIQKWNGQSSGCQKVAEYPHKHCRLLMYRHRHIALAGTPEIRFEVSALCTWCTAWRATCRAVCSMEMGVTGTAQMRSICGSAKNQIGICSWECGACHLQDALLVASAGPDIHRTRPRLFWRARRRKLMHGPADELREC